MLLQQYVYYFYMYKQLYDEGDFMLLKSSPIPYYLQIAKILRDRIVSGEYPIESKILSEKEIVDEYGVSRMTARNAVTELVDEGLVYRKQGVGVFVLKNKLRRDLNRLTGFYEDMKELGFTPKSKIIENIRRKANERERELLDLNDGQEVFFVNRIRLVNDEPMGLQKMTVPVHRVPDFNQLNLEESSFYAYLDKIGLSLERAEQRMEALSSEEICEMLKIENDAPFFYFERISYAQDNKPIELLDSYFRGDFYSYNITLYR